MFGECLAKGAGTGKLAEVGRRGDGGRGRSGVSGVGGRGLCSGNEAPSGGGGGAGNESGNVRGSE